MENTNFSFEAFANKVFDEWVCQKTKINNDIANFAIKYKEENYLVCIKGTNPYTGEYKYLKNGCPFDENTLATFSYTMGYTHNVLMFIIQRVMKEMFVISSSHDSNNFTSTAKYGKELVNMMMSVKNDIYEVCTNKSKSMLDINPITSINIPLNTFIKKRKKDWFDAIILNDGNIDNNGYFSFIVNEKIVNADARIIPFYDITEALAAVIWKKFNIEIIKYTDEFGKIDSEVLPDFRKEIEQNPLEFIKNRCADINMLNSSIEFALKHYYSPVKEQNIYNKIKTIDNLPGKIHLIKTEADNDFIRFIAQGICNRLEY